MLMLCYVFMCFSLLVVVLDVFGVLALFSKFYIGVYYTCDCSCIALTAVLASVLQESQGLTTYDFDMLLLVMIPLNMLTFRLMVTMVAEFCSLVILILNTLPGEIMISSTRTTRSIIPLFPST